jgi:uncharacterized membrane protein
MNTQATTGVTQGRVSSAMTGWVRFAAILLVFAGVMNVIHGFTLLDHKHFVSNQIDYSNLTFWGWVFLIAGIVQIGAGVAVFGRRLIGYQTGVVLAVIAIVMWFLMIFSAPFGAMIGIIVNLSILYGLTVGAGDDWA